MMTAGQFTGSQAPLTASRRRSKKYKNRQVANKVQTIDLQAKRALSQHEAVYHYAEADTAESPNTSGVTTTATTDFNGEGNKQAQHFFHNDGGIFPDEITLFADTDSEGEPQVKRTTELWPSAESANGPKPRLPIPARSSQPACKEGAASPSSRQGSKESAASPSCRQWSKQSAASTCAGGSSRQGSKESTYSFTSAVTPLGSASAGSPKFDDAVPQETGASQSTCAPPSSRQVSKESTYSSIWAATPPGSASADSPTFDDAEVTTLVVRNLSELVTQKEFLEEVNRSGFLGAYDFAYMPCSIDGSRGSGHAFINFRTPELAASFKAAWHWSSRLCATPGKVALNVVAASIQGFFENSGKWTAVRMARMKSSELLPFISQEWGPRPGVDHYDAPDGQAGRQVTTLVVRNLSAFIVQQELLDVVNCSGFAGRYDFAYLPRSRDSGCGSGHAFMNFRSAEDAKAFKVLWHRSTCFGVNHGSVSLNVVASAVQGFQANAGKWTQARIEQVKNPNFLPFIFPTSEASSAPTPVARHQAA